MKKLILVILISVVPILLFAQNEHIVKTIALLQSYSGDAKTLIVSDPVRGGRFNYLNTLSVADNGVIFKATGKSKGYWVRVIANEVYPEWWGTCANNSHSFIQSALYYGSENGKRIVLRNGFYRTDSTLIIPSNTNLEIAAKAVIRMNDGSNRPMFQNKNAVYSGSPETNADSNITIHGKGIISGGIQALLTKDSVLNATISLNNVKNIHISDIRIDTTSAYAVFISSFHNVYISKIDIENRNRPYGKNDDGIHFAGPGKTAYVNDCTIRCSDDAVAILANELRFKYKTNNGGDLSDIHITNIKFNYAASGIRFLASSANILNCSVDNTAGTVLNKILEFGNYGLTPNGGIMDKITINNTSVNVLQHTHSKPVIYFNQGNYGTVSLSNTVINGDLFTNSMIRLGNGNGITTVKNIVITNYRKVIKNHLLNKDRYIQNALLVVLTCWFMSLFYLTGLLIYHQKNAKKFKLNPEIIQGQFGIMAHNLWLIIATPLMIFAYALFFFVAESKLNIHQISVQIRLACLLVFTIYQFICLYLIKARYPKPK